jgi:hypothetical protein
VGYVIAVSQIRKIQTGELVLTFDEILLVRCLYSTTHDSAPRPDTTWLDRMRLCVSMGLGLPVIWCGIELHGRSLV